MLWDYSGIRFGRYRFHPTQGLTHATHELHVTPKSLAVLQTLLERAGEIVTKEELFRSVWPDTSVSDAALTTCIQELRRVLADDARRPTFIETVHRRGFRFIATADDENAVIATSADLPRARSSGPLVGRESAMRQLSAALAAMQQGARHTVFVTGAAGIGKTAVVDTWIDGIGNRSAIRLARAECFEHHGAGEAYQPLLEAIVRLCAQDEGEVCVAALRHCAPTWFAQLPALHTRAGEPAALWHRAAGATPERMLRELTDALESISQRWPLVLCLDDLHWSDAATLDWIASFARRREAARVLVIGTFRPGEMAYRSRTAKSLVDDLGVRGLCIEIPLTPLDAEATRAYVLARFPPTDEARDIVEQLAQAVHVKTEGHPLFLVSALADLLGQRVLTERDQRWTAERFDARVLAIPADVRRTIEHQFDRLADAEQRLLEIASLSGTTCAVAAVAAAADAAETDIEAALDSLARRESFLRGAPAVEWPDGTWSGAFEFRHALHREVVSDRIPPARRVAIHRAMGLRIEAAYAAGAAPAVELAVHFEQARDFRRAVVYLQQAAETALTRAAHALARQHYTRALDLLDKLPPGDERDERETTLQIGLGNVLMQTQGWGAPAVETAYARARQLAETRGAQAPLSALWNLWIFYATGGDLREASRLADRLLALAAQSDHTETKVQAHHAQWSTLFALGDLRGTERHARTGIELADACERTTVAYGGHDAGICARAFCARALAFSGRPDTGAALCDEAVMRARGLGHPFTLAFALMHAAAIYQIRHEAEATRVRADEATAIAEHHGFPLMLAWSTCFLGWARAQLGEIRQGTALLRNGIAAAGATGSKLFLPHMNALLATALAAGGEVALARAAIADAIEMSLRTGERFYLPELYRLQGELCLSDERDTATPVEAECNFQMAMRMAAGQGSALLSLRAAISLVRLARRQGSRETKILDDARAHVIEGAALRDAIEADSLIANP